MAFAQQKNSLISWGFLILYLAVWAEGAETAGNDIKCPTTHEKCTSHGTSICCNKETSTCSSLKENPTCVCKPCPLCPPDQYVCGDGENAICCTNRTTTCKTGNEGPQCIPCTHKDTTCCDPKNPNKCVCCTHSSGKYCVPSAGKCSSCPKGETPCCPEENGDNPKQCEISATDCCAGEFTQCTKPGRCVNQHGCTRSDWDCRNNQNRN